ncbi:MAG: enoyl-CoA hydratase/isomerase family protein [Proteobacteria bacterium]|nr:enoyl-CoA hydratase/isomerase family protein [Pseudomonadota bacterium]
MQSPSQAPSDSVTEALVQRMDRDGVACLSFHNPPVNAINSAVRREIDEALTALAQDDAIEGVVISGAGRLFSGGGDLREIGQPEPAGTPTMTALARRIELFAKPVAVAMQGKAIGGGVLLAMACHARIASRDATILLPEVNLGFSPGAGGTQRLPRLVGIGAAMRMVALAQPLDAASAQVHGFFDEVAQDAQGAVEAAVRRVQAIARGAAPWRRTALLRVPTPSPGETAESLAITFRAMAADVFPEREACQAAIGLILDAATSGADFETGMRREKAEYDRLSSSPQGKALLEQFLAGRAARRA